MSLLHQMNRGHCHAQNPTRGQAGKAHQTTPAQPSADAQTAHPALLLSRHLHHSLATTHAAHWWCCCCGLTLVCLTAADAVGVVGVVGGVGDGVGAAD